MREVVLTFKGNGYQFEEFLEFIDEYLDWNPGATIGDLASDEVLDIH